MTIAFQVRRIALGLIATPLVLAGAALHFFAVLFYVIPWPVTAA